MRPVTLPPLALDYAAPSGRHRWLWIVLLAASLTAAAQLVLRYRDVVQQRATLQARLDLLEVGRRSGHALNAARATQDAAGVEQVVRQLTLPWPEMIEAVESTPRRQVALLQLQPEAGGRTLRLTAEAGSAEAMLDYVRRLGESQALARVHLVSHQMQTGNASRVVQFVAQASLREAP
jgi:type IV pilus assembly PilN-like protein